MDKIGGSLQYTHIWVDEDVKKIISAPLQFNALCVFLWGQWNSLDLIHNCVKDEDWNWKLTTVLTEMWLHSGNLQFNAKKKNPLHIMRV